MRRAVQKILIKQQLRGRLMKRPWSTDILYEKTVVIQLHGFFKIPKSNDDGVGIFEEVFGDGVICSVLS